MRGLLRILFLISAIAVGLALLTEYQSGGSGLDAQTVVLGLPVVSIAQVGAQGWIAFGQAASGVLVFAQAGAGVVAITQVGIAVFFGIGQGMLALCSIAQVGAGPFFFLGQGGVGAQAIGQGVYKERSGEHFKVLSDEVNAVLRAPFAALS